MKKEKPIVHYKAEQIDEMLSLLIRGRAIVFSNLNGLTLYLLGMGWHVDFFLSSVRLSHKKLLPPEKN